MSNKPYNIIIAGVGGQGIVTLTKIILNWCNSNNYKVHSSIFKGGAQTLGSVHSEIKIAMQDIPHFEYFSPQIKEGEANLLIGLELFETLRYFNLCNEQTTIVANNCKIPFWVDRLRENRLKDPANFIKEHFKNYLILDAEKIALEKHSNKKMMNTELVHAGITEGLIPFPSLRSFLTINNI